MGISKKLAQNIVEDMKKIINNDVNFFDIRGITIASTDRNRIGTFNEGAKKAIQFNNDLIVDYDGQYEGARRGINLPVHFDNQVVGAIGITGGKEKIEKYGEIIQRMTEILVKEAYIQEQELLNRESKKQFTEELIFGTDKDDKVLRGRASLLDINLDIPRIVIAIRTLDIEEDGLLLSPNLNERIFDSFMGFMNNNSQNLIIQNGMDIILIIGVRTYMDVEKRVCYIKEKIEKLYNISMYCGIGDIAENHRKIKNSYRKAKKALDVAVAFKDRDVLHYDDLDIELLIDYIPKDIIDEFSNRIFGEMDSKELYECMEVMDKFIKHNGSITRAAAELFIHKNTLQYKLNKIKKLTGYDPRVIDEMIVLYTGFVFYRMERMGNK